MFQRTSWACVAAVLGLTIVSGCGLFSKDSDDDPFDLVIKQDVDVEFAIDDEMLCPPTEDCTAPTAPSPGPIDLPEVNVPVEVDIIALTMNEQLSSASGRLKKVEIESIDYVIAPNTLNIPSPPLGLYITPTTATSKDANGAAFIGTLPSADPSTEKTGTLTVTEEDQAKSSDLFKALKFKVIANGDKDIEAGEQFPAQGRTDYKLTFNLKFSASPADQF